MTVTELINHLMTLNGDLEVYVQGYESGYTDITIDNIEPIEVCREFYNDQEGGKDSWDGSHEEFNAVRKGPADPFKYEVKKGIVFTR